MEWISKREDRIPLWKILYPSTKVSILNHEIDQVHTFYLGSALRVLQDEYLPYRWKHALKSYIINESILSDLIMYHPKIYLVQGINHMPNSRSNIKYDVGISL